MFQKPGDQSITDKCRVTSTYMFPYKEDLVRFDFEVSAEDEHMFTPFQSSKF